MKTKGLILLAVVTLTVATVTIFLGSKRGADPVLLFKGYSSVPTSATQIANFELCNASSRALWLSYGGREFPLNAPFLERPVGISAKTDNSLWTNISASVGHYFEQGNEVLPGQSLLLEFPLVSGQPPAQIGVDLYIGNFRDGNDFLSNLGTTMLDVNANLKDKAIFYFEKFKRDSKGAKRHEVWCAQIVCFESAASQARAVHPGGREEKTKQSNSPARN